MLPINARSALMSDEILKVTNVSRVYETSGGGFGRKNKV